MQEKHRALDIFGQIEVDMGGSQRATVIGSGQHVVLAFVSWSDIRALLAPFSREGRQRWLRRLAGPLQFSDARLNVELAGRCVAVLRDPEGGGTVARLCSVQPLEIKPWQLLRAWWTLLRNRGAA
ncbi:MAG: hypothetical protein HKP27_11530 [Myxococcales bacterium]|nr:hypothetical protein [Myxococcales bacterium]